MMCKVSTNVYFIGGHVSNMALQDQFNTARLTVKIESIIMLLAYLLMRLIHGRLRYYEVLKMLKLER